MREPKKPIEMTDIVIISQFTAILLRCFFGGGLCQCYTVANCTGEEVAAADQRDCCVGTNDGLSYINGSTCNRCIVFGFENATYDVNEDDRLDTMFLIPAKGEPSDVIPGLVISGIITAEAAGTSDASDFERLLPIRVSNTAASIRLFTANDDISLEYDDRVQLVFTSDNPALVPGVEGLGQYIRTTATVRIIDCDVLQINFDQSDYFIVEGSATPSSPITLQFRQNQNPFTIMLSPVTVATAEAAGVGDFINADIIDPGSRATDSDFSSGTINILIPANRMSFEMRTFFSVIDDDVNEVQQSFAIIADIIDVPENVSCFQRAIGESLCQGRRGATAIRITDNDPMIIGFTERRRSVSEGIVPEGEDVFRLIYPVAALRTSEIDYPMVFRLLEGISTATVNTRHELQDPDILHNNDAIFGDQREENDPIQVSRCLLHGSTTLPQDLPTYIRGDFVAEDDECYRVQIISVEVELRRFFQCNSEAVATNYFCEHEICIIDDDEPFEVSFVETVYTVDESVSAVSVCVSLTKPDIDILNERVQVFVIDNSSSVYIPLGGPLAMPDAPDFLIRYLMLERTDFAQQTGSINAIDNVFITELMRIVCYNQTIYEDLRLELDEYAGLTLGVNEIGTTALTVVRSMYDEASILIVDNDSESPCIRASVDALCRDDTEATLGLEQTFLRVEENEGYVELCANVSFPEITCPIEFPFDVSLSTADGTAVQTMDYGAIDVILEFDSCETRKCVNVSIVNDLVDEEDEIFTYHLRRTPNLYSRIRLEPMDGIVEIIDDDVNITVGYNQTSYVTSEVQGMVELRIEIFDPPTGGAPRPFTLVINTQNDTAIEGAPDMDYVVVNGEIVQFAMGDIFQTHTIIIKDDDVCEHAPNEFFFSNIALHTSVEPIFVIQPQATVTIDDAAEPECLIVSFEQTSYTVTEGKDEFVEVTLVRSGDLSRNSTVTLTTFDASALAGLDYTYTEEVITFEPGEAMALIRIPIVDNTAVESDEMFIAALSSEDNNTVIDDKSVTMIMILDPDTYCLNYTDFKNGGVSLSGVSVGDTATFTCNDGYELVGDSFLICLSDGTWDSSPPVCQGPTVSFEPSTYTVTEGVDEFVELIIKAENVKNFVVINVSLTSESAKAGSDFEATPKLKVLAPGQRDDTVKVIIIDDSTPEETEIFTAILSTGGMTTPAMANVTILDNDSIRGGKPSSNSGTIITATIITVVIVLIAAVIVTFTLIVVTYYRKKRRSKVDLPTPEPICDDPDSHSYAYNSEKKVSSSDTTGLSRISVKDPEQHQMKQNLAYGVPQPQELPSTGVQAEDQC